MEEVPDIAGKLVEDIPLEIAKFNQRYLRSEHNQRPGAQDCRCISHLRPSQQQVRRCSRNWHNYQIFGLCAGRERAK